MLLPRWNFVVSGVRVETYAANVADEASVEQTFSAIAADFGGIDGLINNAGILRDGLLLKYKDGVAHRQNAITTVSVGD
ncbi:MAG: SDR family oxidoreductase [Rheinheimera sp.]|nr:SDR family oxidoreductase [Rheinheimera sp.]